MPVAYVQESVKIRRSPAYSTSLAEEFQKLRAEGELLDCIIKCGDCLYLCHRTILAGNSPVLKEIIKQNLMGPSTPEIKLNIPADIFEILLDYMYIGETSIPHEKLLSIVEAAVVLKMVNLREVCIDEAVLQPSNVIPWYQLGKQCDIASLKSRCSGVLFPALDEVSKRPAFLEMNAEAIGTFLDDAEQAGAKIDNLLGAVIAWINYKSDERGECLMRIANKGILDLTELSSECLGRIIKHHKDLLLQYPDAKGKYINAYRRRRAKGAHLLNSKIIILRNQNSTKTAGN